MTRPAERDPSLMLWLIGEISRWVKTAEQPVRLAETIVDGLTAAGRLLPADRVADAVLVRQAAEADIARQVLILAEDPKILAMWADACDPRPVTVADHFRALAGKLARPIAAEEPA